MSAQIVVSKLQEFGRWFFWEQQWSQEKILVLVGMVLFVVLLRAVIARKSKTTTA